MKSVAEFIHDAMYGPEGYYIKSDPIGKNNDFITAPEISQLFGEMIGVYCANTWMKMEQPKEFALIELGPGKATLMLDLLRATKNIPGFHQSFRIHLVEKNQQLIKIQKERLHDHDVTWHDDISTLPDNIPQIIIANEFFDCLPINQYIYLQGHWYEIYISPDYEMIEVPTELKFDHPNIKEGDIVEVCYPAQNIIQQLTSKKATKSILIVDYGYDADPLIRRGYNSTLQAIHKHKFTSIFENIGNSDITAHIDFFTLKQIALKNGYNIVGSITQRDFLLSLGIEMRANILKQNIKHRKAIESGLYRLIDKNEMGDLFRVLEINDKI